MCEALKRALSKSSGEMMKVLQENDDIMKQICDMYAQDVICFDYELPSACEGLF